MIALFLEFCEETHSSSKEKTRKGKRNVWKNVKDVNIKRRLQISNVTNQQGLSFEKKTLKKF